VYAAAAVNMAVVLLLAKFSYVEAAGDSHRTLSWCDNTSFCERGRSSMVKESQYVFLK
jgi:hypothetical protein